MEDIELLKKMAVIKESVLEVESLERRIKDIKERAEPLIQELLEKYPEHENLFMFFNEPDAYFKRMGNAEVVGEKKKQKRNDKIKIHHLSMGKLLKTPAVVETFFNLAKQSNLDLTEEDCNKAI